MLLRGEELERKKNLEILMTTVLVMDISKSIEKIKDFQSILIDYFDDKHHSEDNYQRILKIFSSHDIQTNKLELKPFLYLIQKNFNNQLI